MKGTQRSHIQKGLEVHIVLKSDQRTGPFDPWHCERHLD